MLSPCIDMASSDNKVKAVVDCGAIIEVMDLLLHLNEE